MGRQQAEEESVSGGFLDGGRRSLAVLDLKKAGDGVNADGGRDGGLEVRDD